MNNLNAHLEPLEARIKQTQIRMDGLVSMYHMLALSKVTQKAVIERQIEECEAMIEQFNVAIESVIEDHLKEALGEFTF